jgi:hypothetical protein
MIFQSIKGTVERVLLWAIRAFLVRYSVVIAQQFAKRDAEAIAFKAAVIAVAGDHHARLLKLEQTAQLAEVA